MGTSKIRNWHLWDRVIDVLPPVIGRAVHTGAGIGRDGSQEPRAYPVRIAVFVFILVGSNMIARNVDLDKEFVASALTALSILAGFLMSVLLFTGNVDILSQLDHNAVSHVAERLSALLRFQSKTFFVYMLSIFICLVWFLTPNGMIRTGVETLALTSIVYSLLRSLLLPLQLYELHSFRFKNVVQDRKKAAQQAWHEKYTEILAAGTPLPKPSTEASDLHVDTPK